MLQGPFRVPSFNGYIPRRLQPWIYLLFAFVEFMGSTPKVLRDSLYGRRASFRHVYHQCAQLRRMGGNHRRMPLLPVLVQGAPSEIYPTAHDRRGNDGMLSRNDVFPHRHRRAHHLPALGHSAYPQHPEEDASLELCGKKNEEKSCIIQRFMLTLQTKS